MNEYQWFDESILAEEYPNQNYITKRKIPVWVIALVTSVLTSVILITVFAIFILPNLRTPTTIHYSAPPVASQDENFSQQGEFSISQLAEKCTPSTVYVSSSGIIGGFFRQQISLGNGSGVIISSDGYILTSSSVVNSGTDIKVTLSDGKEFPANLVGSDAKTDIAILKIEANGLFPAVLGDSSYLKIGDPILAIGNPLGPKITNTVTSGIISGINNNVSLRDGLTMNLLQTDTVLSTGSFGGALFNFSGEVIGIVATNVSSDSNISFLIPINDIKPLLASYLNAEGTINSSNDNTPMLGLTGTDEDYGVIVESINEDMPAAKAGIKVGDMIIKVDGIPINTIAKINEIRMAHQTGDTLNITVYRDGELFEFNAVLE